MTDAPRPRKKRWSKRAVRATAWTAGAAAFISALGGVRRCGDPGRLRGGGVASAPTRQKVIIRRIVKRVVIVDAAPPAPVRVVSSGGVGSVSPLRLPFRRRSPRRPREAPDMTRAHHAFRAWGPTCRSRAPTTHSFAPRFQAVEAVFARERSAGSHASVTTAS
jgi:hypothetical protein